LKEKQESKMTTETEKKIWAYALKNAIEHEGKAQTNSVLNSLFHEGLKKEKIKSVLPAIQKAVDYINSLSPESQKKEFSQLENEIDRRKIRKGLPDLPNVGERVVMRFAPFPSGPLHIGNARILLLNDEYVKKYKGELLLVIDDTIGSAKKQIMPETYDLIKEGIKMLGANYSREYKKSDRLELYYDYAEKLIKKGKAYVCSCSIEELRENRKQGKECSCRQFPVAVQLERWKKMFKASPEEYTLRLKTNMQYKDPAFRDRVIFRISDREHPLTKNRYRVWPLLDFSWAVDDHLLEITHVLRGKELMIETEMEKYIFDIFGWKHPEFMHMGLLNFEGIKISKSKGQKEIKEGKYTGWDDPRTWSIQSLIKRGIEPEALRKFLISLGIKPNEITVPIDILYAENRKLLREKAKREKITLGPGNIQVIMPDGKVTEGNADITPALGELFYFIKFGYCKFNEIKNKKLVFYFAHK